MYLILDRLNQNSTVYVCVVGKYTVMNCDKVDHSPNQWRKWVRHRLTEWWKDLEEVINEDNVMEQNSQSSDKDNNDDQRNIRTL